MAGIRTPRPIGEMQGEMGEAFAELAGAMATLETHYRDLQDVEFTVERGKLYILQTRAGKRTAQAAVRVARELVAEGVIERDEAVQRINAGQLDQLMHPRSTRARITRCSPRASTPHRVPPSAGRCSTPTRPRRAGGRASP